MSIQTYHRPQTVEEVLSLLARPQAALLAGGTGAVPRLARQAAELVDLQAVGLDEISYTHNRVTLGAMIRLQTIIEDDRTPALLRQTAHREAPSTLRRAATIGGTVVKADWESELLAALLVYEAEVTVQSVAGTRTLPLANFLADVGGVLNGGLVTAVSAATLGVTASERVARTPADRPIVAAVARRDDQDQTRLALCGVAATPILVQADDLNQLKASLNPPDDFRGSRHYRRQMAITLARRVIDALAE